MMKNITLLHLGRAVMTLLLVLFVSTGTWAQEQTHTHTWKVTHANVAGSQLKIHLQCTTCSEKANQVVATSYTILEVQDPDKPNKTIIVYCFDAEAPDGFQFENYYYSPNNQLVVAPLEDAQDNTELISSLSSTNKSIFVFLNGRTLFKDGGWNTICLPFNLTAEQVTEQLAPTQLMTLSSTDFADNTLNMTFETASAIEAGKPYIIKWDGGEDVLNPMFVGVTMTAVPASSIQTDYATFIGTYSPVQFEDNDKSILFMGSSDYLYYPESDAYANAFRGYFQLADGYLCGEPLEVSDVNRFELHFEGNEASAIVRINNDKEAANNDAWYTLSGMRLSKQPTTQGIYIHNGRKVLLK